MLKFSPQKKKNPKIYGQSGQIWVVFFLFNFVMLLNWWSSIRDYLAKFGDKEKFEKQIKIKI
jgi:hypothetical protein